MRSQRIKVELAYRPPYDWEYMRAFFSLRQVHANELVTSGCLQKILRINDQTVLMTAEHRAEKNLFEVTFELQELSILKDCIRAVRQMLDLDSDSLNITKMVARSGLPKQYIAEGLRLPGVIDKFEAGCRAIIGQQVSVKAAIGQLNLLHDTLLGSSVGSLRPFICANKVANADLSFLKMPQARKDTLKRLAQFIVESPNSHPKEWLTIKGVGPWTVNYVIMRTSTIPDIFLDTDLVVKNRISALLSQGIELKPDNSAPWRSYLTLSLWNAEGLNKHSSNK